MIKCARCGGGEALASVDGRLECAPEYGCRRHVRYAPQESERARRRRMGEGDYYRRRRPRGFRR